jgi:hypothetical protein
MPHYTTGLPKLDLEPFDPSPLYAAARSPRRDDDQPGHRTGRRPFSALVLAVVVLLCLAGLAGYLFL